jgi:hypothetical protein
MTKAEKIQVSMVFIFLVVGTCLVLWTGFSKYENSPNLKRINDSLVNVLKQKDSVLNLKDTL